MTDNEIIKALECCVKGLECKNCPANPHKGNYGYCTSLLLKAALDLINRQKAEIEDIRRKALLEAASKFAGHSNYHGDTILCTLICMAEGQEVADAKPIEYFSGNQIKAEAYKEFAERLKEKSKQGRGYLGNVYHSVDVAEIDNLLKEMVGDNNA